MSKDECSLLLYFESIAVDKSGVVDPRKINAADIELAKKWDRDGFCSFKRFTERQPLTGDVKALTYLVTLSDEAWALAHAERRARAARLNIIEEPA